MVVINLDMCNNESIKLDRGNNMIKYFRQKKLKKILQIELDSEFSYALLQYLEKQCSKKYDPTNLNEYQKTLYLCIWLEDFSISDGILTFINDVYCDYHNEIVLALRSIGAVKSSNIIRDAINILPADGECFLKTSTQELREKMRKLDQEFCSYPDGKLCSLYRKYVVKYFNEL